jgi:predicted transcriptional regulator
MPASEDKPIALFFRAPPELVKKIDQLADADDRSRASWLRHYLGRLTQQPTEAA